MSSIKKKSLLCMFACLPTLVFSQSDGSHLERGITAEILLEVCGVDGSREEELICLGYIRGVIDGLLPFRRNPIHCVPGDIESAELLSRLDLAHLHLLSKDLIDDIRLEKERTDLSQLSAARFLHWAFTVTIPYADPVSYSCSASESVDESFP